MSEFFTKSQQREALAALSRLRLAYVNEVSSEQYREREALFGEALYALVVLTRLLYGASSSQEGLFLCETCHLAREMLPAPCDEQGWLLSICTTCYQRRQQQGGRAGQREVG